MGFTKRKERDGTGPKNDSYQRKNVSPGKRQQQGVPCPAPKK